MKCESEEVFLFFFLLFSARECERFSAYFEPFDAEKSDLTSQKRPFLTQKSLFFSISQLSTKIFLEKMNVFRLLGDLSHLFAILLLLAKIWKSKSVTGLSGKSQVNLNLKTARFSHILTPELLVYYLF